MKQYEKELKKQLKMAQKAALAGLGYVVVAQRKLEKVAKDVIGKSGAKRKEVKHKTEKLLNEAVKEQKIAQKQLEEKTKKALAMMVKESQKQLKILEGKLDKKKR